MHAREDRRKGRGRVEEGCSKFSEQSGNKTSGAAASRHVRRGVARKRGSKLVCSTSAMRAGMQGCSSLKGGPLALP